MTSNPPMCLLYGSSHGGKKGRWEGNFAPENLMCKLFTVSECVCTSIKCTTIPSSRLGIFSIYVIRKCALLPPISMAIFCPLKKKCFSCFYLLSPASYSGSFLKLCSRKRPCCHRSSSVISMYVCMP